MYVTELQAKSKIAVCVNNDPKINILLKIYNSITYLF
ncbi:hypothetical protein M2419_003141 [Sphingobacterium sp. BIGb0116]|nr:hypothetical protein [Sphingobacterium sp. BIGb0116]